MTKADLKSLLSSLRNQSKELEAHAKCRGGCPPSCWMDHSHSEDQLIENEQLLSLKAMVAFTSHKTGLAEYRIERDIADRFCIPNMKCLPKAQYDSALRFVCDRSAAS